MSTRIPPWISRQLGRRGLTLIVLGIAFLIIAAKTILYPAEADLDTRFLLHTLIPPAFRAIIWGVPGVAALIAAFRPTGRDGFGFALLTMPLTLMVFSYLWSVISFFAGFSTWPLGWASALVWLMLLAFVLIVSGWPEVPTAAKPKHQAKTGAHLG